MAGVGFAIEERSGEVVLLQVLSERMKTLRIVRQIDREFLVLRLRGGDEFGQTDGAQQAGCDPAGKGVAGAGQDRQAGPERIAGCGVGVVGEGVQKEAGEPLPRQMLIYGQRFGKDEPLGIDPTPRGFGAQIFDGPGIVVHKPENAALDAPEDAHPSIKYIRRYLENVIEAAINKC